MKSVSNGPFKHIGNAAMSLDRYACVEMFLNPEP
jgi:hypothetical protein